MTQKESIWTKDLTPHVVNFMTADITPYLTADITPDFSGEVWTPDITHHVVGSMAVFGLVVSAGVMTLGVTTLSVKTEVAFAQEQDAVYQTAAVVMADNQIPPPPMASSTLMFCPQLSHTISRGSSEG